ERTVETVAAILGVLQAGCAYLPVDLDQPAERTTTILNSAAPKLLLCSAAAGSGPTGLARLVLDAKAWDDSWSDTSMPSPARAGQPASPMSTSGPSGVGKLVDVPHRNVAYNVTSLRTAIGGIAAQDVYLHFASFAFSSSVRQLFLPLISGARIVLASGSER